MGLSTSKFKRAKAAFQLGLVIIALLAAVVSLYKPHHPTTHSETHATNSSRSVLVPVPSDVNPTRASYTLEPQSLDELLSVPAVDLHEVDIARVNLLCASNLPSTAGLDIDHALAKLDEWAEKVADETARHLYRVSDPRYAAHYGHSEARFRAEMLAQVLQEDLGVHYNMDAVGSFSFADATTGFVHGMIPKPGEVTADTPGGTCASMPVLYVSVGRRLGYPLKLVTTDSHVFARWEGLNHAKPEWRDRFNCETTGGFSIFDDAYYRTWPKQITEQQVIANGYLQSLTPTEELAMFMATRGHHGEDVGQLAFAARCYENAYRYDKYRPCYLSWFLDVAAPTDYQAATPELIQPLAIKRQRNCEPLTITPLPYRRVATSTLPNLHTGVQQPPEPTAYYEPPSLDFR